MDDNIMKLAKHTHMLKCILLLLLLLFTKFLPTLLILFIRHNLPNVNKIFKQECLDSKIDDMALATYPLLCGIPLNIFIFKKILTNYTAESVISTGVISNNSPKLSYNSEVLQNWKQSILLVIPTMTSYHVKSKKSLYSLLLVVDKVSTDYKKKIVI